MGEYNVLIFQPRCWNDTDAPGNTLSNLFECFSGWNFMNVFFRGFSPSNNLSNIIYYQISMKNLLNPFVKTEEIGSICKAVESDSVPESSFRNSSLLSYVKKLRINKLAYHILKNRWLKVRWDNSRFRSAIYQFDPDIAFMYASDPVFLAEFIRRLKGISNIPIVLYVVDDVYETLCKKEKILFLNSLQEADYVYAISEPLVSKYSELTSRDVHLLLKGGLYDLPLKKKSSLSRKIVYAGNLLYGRVDTLKLLVNEIRNYNSSHTSGYFLDIYSNSEITESDRNEVIVSGCSALHPVRPFSEIRKVMNDADIVLHVESFDDKDIQTVKHSFSTKIIDCMESGSSFFVIGPECDSSIAFACRVPGVIAALTKEEISLKLNLMADSEYLNDSSMMMREYGLANYSMDKNKQLLLHDFGKITGR